MGCRVTVSKKDLLPSCREQGQQTTSSSQLLQGRPELQRATSLKATSFLGQPHPETEQRLLQTVCRCLKRCRLQWGGVVQVSHSREQIALPSCGIGAAQAWLWTRASLCSWEPRKAPFPQQSCKCLLPLRGLSLLLEPTPITEQDWGQARVLSQPRLPGRHGPQQEAGRLLGKREWISGEAPPLAGEGLKPRDWAASPADQRRNSGCFFLCPPLAAHEPIRSIDPSEDHKTPQNQPQQRRPWNDQLQRGASHSRDDRPAERNNPLQGLLSAKSCKNYGVTSSREENPPQSLFLSAEG
ncbi:hypothetical protein AAY473_005726 [Plecturocebus cupreus]